MIFEGSNFHSLHGLPETKLTTLCRHDIAFTEIENSVMYCIVILRNHSRSLISACHVTLLIQTTMSLMEGKSPSSGPPLRCVQLASNIFNYHLQDK